MNTSTNLYINDVLVPLPANFKFAFTFRPFDISDMAGRNISYTNAVTLPLTPLVMQLFGFINNEKNGSRVQYQKLPCKLIQDGYEVLPSGVCWVVDVDADKGIKITLLDASFDVFNVIQSRKLNALSHIADSTWTATDIDNNRNTTSNLIAAIIDWGKNGGASIYNSATFLPSFFYHSFIRTILQQTGVTLSGNILTDSAFNQLVIPFSNGKWAYPESLTKDYEFKVCKNSVAKNIVIAADAGNPSTEVIGIDYDTNNPPNTYQGAARIFNIGTFKATVPSIGSNQAWLSCILGGSLYFNIVTWAAGAIGRFAIRVLDKNGVQRTEVTADFDFATYGASPVNGVQISFPSQAVDLYDGDQIDMVVKTKVGSGSGAITISMLRGTVAPYTSMSLISQGTSIGTPIRWKLLLPDLWQRDLVKDFFARFGIIHNIKNNVLYLKTIREITEDIANAVDWTGKRNNYPDKISYSPPGFGRENWFTYQPDSLGLQTDDNAGASSFNTENQNLEGGVNQYDAPFEATLDATVFSVNAAAIRVYDSTSAAIGDFKNEPGIRLCTIRSRIAGEPGLTLNVTLRNDYRIANFLVSGNNSKDTSWGYFLSQYYGPVFLSAMKRLTVISRQYMLTTPDIAGFDPLKMVTDNGSYFLVLEIENFIPGQPTNVKLLKII